MSKIRMYTTYRMEILHKWTESYNFMIYYLELSHTRRPIMIMIGTFSNPIKNLSGWGPQLVKKRRKGRCLRIKSSINNWIQKKQCRYKETRKGRKFTTRRDNITEKGQKDSTTI